MFGSVPTGVRAAGVYGVVGRGQCRGMDLVDRHLDLAAQEEQVNSPIRGDDCRQSLARWNLCCCAVGPVKADSVFDGEEEMHGRL